MILADFKGDLIHATIKKQQFNKRQRLIVFGDWRIIENFQLSRSTGKFRATKHQYRMTIMNSTIISRCDFVSNDFYLDLASFDNILADDGLNENILIDVVGQVVSSGEIKTSELNDKPQKEVRGHPSRYKTKCGQHVMRQMRVLNDVYLIFVGERTISNAFDMSLLLINAEDYPTVQDFVIKLPQDDLKITFGERNCDCLKPKHEVDDYINQFPRSSIPDLLEAQMEGKFKIYCSIYHIDMEFGWYYFTCVKCKGTCLRIKEMFIDPLVIDLAYARYKLVLDVMDSSGESKFILFDNNAIKIVNQTTTDVLGGQYDKIQDPTIVPPALQALVGKSFLFLASVETANIVNGKETYKNDPMDMISNEVQDQTNSNVIGTSVTTPSSKRKEDSNDDATTQSSTSKKQCLPSINQAIEEAKEKIQGEEEKIQGEEEKIQGEEDKIQGKEYARP
ncbi:PREDICTED: uncharacterized protein LOC104715353 [Camelina sativa]|uniref:Uncharacterized protein LOC104715353 n=1 Tax=Camelina sativa TaxID=90675 RepID=A0ABM0TTD7_CAMSA|nr:PREDICTED: uncharacterized protein LOC104715353 [Camelina sativa]